MIERHLLACQECNDQRMNVHCCTFVQSAMLLRHQLAIRACLLRGTCLVLLDNPDFELATLVGVVQTAVKPQVGEGQKVAI